MYWWYLFPQGFVHGWDSVLMWACHKQTIPLYSTCCWLEVPCWDSQKQGKKVGGGAHKGVHTYSNPALICALTQILSIHWYVQLSTGIFTELQTSEVCKFSQPYFPILKFSCVFAECISFSALLTFFIFLSAQCHSQVLPILRTLVLFLFLSLQLWITLNFSQPSLSALLLQDTSQCK